MHPVCYNPFESDFQIDLCHNGHEFKYPTFISFTICVTDLVKSIMLFWLDCECLKNSTFIKICAPNVFSENFRIVAKPGSFLSDFLAKIQYIAVASINPLNLCSHSYIGQLN